MLLFETFDSPYLCSLSLSDSVLYPHFFDTIKWLSIHQPQTEVLFDSGINTTILLQSKELNQWLYSDMSVTAGSILPLFLKSGWLKTGLMKSLSICNSWGNPFKFSDWKYRQIIDAIQNLFLLTEAPWATHFDWPSLMDYAHSLQSDNTTILRGRQK